MNGIYIIIYNYGDSSNKYASHNFTRIYFDIIICSQTVRKKSAE